MLCLSDSKRHDDPSVQQLICTIDAAHTLTQLMLAVWPLARVLARHIIESVLAESHGLVSGPRGAAARLGIPPTTLESKIKRFAIDKYRFRSRDFVNSR